MIWQKSCPRCHGDLVLQADINGQYIACLQCGYELTDDEYRLLRKRGSLAACSKPVAPAA